MRKKFRNSIIFIHDLVSFLYEINIPAIKILAFILVVQIPVLVAILIAAMFASAKEIVYPGIVFITGSIIIVIVFEANKTITLTTQKKFDDFFVHPKRNHFYLIKTNYNEHEKDFQLIKMLAGKRYTILTDDEIIIDKQWVGDEVLVREIKEKKEIESIKVLNELL